MRFKTIKEYFSYQTPEKRRKLEEMRQIIKKLIPDAEEIISYQMPAFRYHGRGLVYYAVWKDHIGFYPYTSKVILSKKELAKYEFSKGTIKFPINKPIPVALVRKVVKFRMKQNEEGKKIR